MCYSGYKASHPTSPPLSPRDEQTPLLALRPQLPADPAAAPGPVRGRELQTSRVPLEAGPGGLLVQRRISMINDCQTGSMWNSCHHPGVIYRCVTKSGITTSWTWSSPPSLCLWMETPSSPSWWRRITRCMPPRSRPSSPSEPAGKVTSSLCYWAMMIPLQIFI